jgi:hypothetical protein
MTIRLEVDSDSNDSDGGYDSEPDSDVAETRIPSDGEYAGEPDGDGAEINIGAAAGTIESTSGSESTIGAVVGSNSTGTTIPSDGEYDAEPDGDGAEPLELWWEPLELRRDLNQPLELW